MAPKLGSRIPEGRSLPRLLFAETTKKPIMLTRRPTFVLAGSGSFLSRGCEAILNGTLRILIIQQGVGFSESQNMAGPVTIFFIAAGAYLPHSESRQRWILVCVPLLALLATLSRSAIISFLLAFTLLFCLDKLSVITQRDRTKAPAVKDTGLVLLALGFAVVAALLGIYLVNKSLLQAVLSGFGLSGGPSVILSDIYMRGWTSGGGA
jgi:hypothetical protein